MITQLFGVVLLYSMSLFQSRRETISASTDGSGMKMNMGGEYFEEKYGDGKKKFIKVTITADPYDKDLLRVEVALEGEGLFLFLCFDAYTQSLTDSEATKKSLRDLLCSLF